MRISGKVVILATLLFALVAVDGFIGQRLLDRMGGELDRVVTKDVVLMQVASSVTRHQLQKAVIFERVRRIADELAYESPTPARKEHLLFHVNLAKTSFEKLAKEGALSIVNGKLVVDQGLKAAQTPEMRKRLEHLSQVLREIEKAHIHYDALLGDVFTSLLAEKFEIPTESLTQIHRDEQKLADELQHLVDAIEKFIQGSQERAKDYRETAERILWVVLGISLLVGALLAVSIIRSITVPLKALTRASGRIGAGEHDVYLDEERRDEFGKVSRAFNRMSQQIKDDKLKLEAQSNELQRNLEFSNQQKKDLEKVNHELDRFVYTVSHDIRSPLMGIAWYADFLKKQQYERLDQKGRDSLDGVCRGVDRANALIKDLLALTRLTRIRNPYQYTQVMLIVDEIIASLDYRIREHHVTVKVQSELPTIICDPIKIKEVFLNLITNAIKFSSRNTSEPQVEIGYIDQADVHEFFVKDNGIGIDPRNHEEIFAMFKRLDVSGSYEGTGAGLSIVKSIVEDHGGKIWVESRLEQGAAFHFFVPKSLQVRQSPDENSPAGGTA